MSDSDIFEGNQNDVMWQPMGQPLNDEIIDFSKIYDSNLKKISDLKEYYLFAIFNDYTPEGMALPSYYVDIVVRGFGHYLKCICEEWTSRYFCKHTRAIRIFCGIVWEPPQITYYDLFENIFQCRVNRNSYPVNRPILYTGSRLYKKICEYLTGDMKKEQTLVTLDNFNKSRKITMESVQNET